MLLQVNGGVCLLGSLCELIPSAPSPEPFSLASSPFLFRSQEIPSLLIRPADESVRVRCAACSPNFLLIYYEDNRTESVT